ncbi:MAG: FAD:protein FMN transferase [Dehalococcoidia bacterium]|jgi:thiamine biosynthesis lipoprotein|nr:FAD:protein FMN transferase [Dehalococcoidia bacterium]
MMETCGQGALELTRWGPALGVRFWAMGCQMSAWLASPVEKEGERALQVVVDFMRRVEARLSRFLPESELSRLNTHGYISASPLLWAVLRQAIRAARATGGLFDPTVLPALEAAGYHRPFALLEPDDVPPRRPFSICWRCVRLHPLGREVRLGHGVRVDLGGIAKGWAADQAARFLSRWGPCLVDAGGDIAVRGAPPGWPGWPVGIADPGEDEVDMAVLCLKGGGVATSGVDYRRWRRKGRDFHHIIHPRTGMPARTDLLSVTVWAPSTLWAEVMAKVALILGGRRGWRWLRARRLPALLVWRDGRARLSPEMYPLLWRERWL